MSTFTKRDGIARNLCSILASCIIALAFASALSAQSITSGTVTGVVTDPSGATVASAPVTLTNLGTSAVTKVVTGTQGDYRFSFVAPGRYRVSVSATGFAPQTVDNVTVAAGEPTSANFTLQLTTGQQAVTVTESSSILQTENADTTTTFDREMVEALPNPGGDLTYIAQTAPGVVMNTQSGYGNFVQDGMPGISNLFTVNGINYNDPFFGINNSGASNLLLGQNDIGEANVINHPYSGQYGQYAGSQVSYITKSGTNDFHGNAVYNWNGSALNANQFFSNASGLSRSFDNFNQWAAGAQGPIIKNRTFFDVDYEGLRIVLPGAANEYLVPSAAFQNATLAHLLANGNAAEIPFYQKAFAIYNNAPGAALAPVPASQNGGCGTDASGNPLDASAFGLASGTPCADEFRSTPPNRNKEYQWSARVDHIVSENDRFTVRVLRDNGFQPTFTSPFGPTFNGQSNQPQMNGNISETHTFGPNTVNEFKGGALYYSAVFVPSDLAGELAALPTELNFSGGTFASVGAAGAPGPNFYLPNGRRIFQYQIIDDLSHVHGKHTLRVGFSWLHWSITDLDFESIGGPVYGGITTTLTDFYNGGGPSTSLTQAFPSSLEQALAFNTYGGYVADEWKVTDRLTLSLNLRLENYSNPTCQANCFSRLSSDFSGTPDAASASTPYNQMIVSGQRNAYPNTQTAVWEPRIGLAWKVSNNTVVRTGGGVFADELPGGLAESAAFNPPGFNSFTIGNGNIAPGVAGSLFTAASQANQALLGQFAGGGSFNSISAAVPTFSAPTFYNFPHMFYQPKYFKWNFEVQQALGTKTSLSIDYSGMHGEHIPVDDGGLNAYCPTSVCTSGFAGLPTTPANAALGTVQQYLSAGVANYNGVTASLQRRLSQGFTFNLNYTWSHSLDDVSNGGIGNLPFGILSTNESLQFPQNPYSIRSNYASSDYDARQYVSANFVLEDLFRHARMKWGPNRIFGGWQLTTNWFWRTGLPYTPVDGLDTGALLGFNYEGTVFASPLTALPESCGANVNTPCMTTSQFAAAGALTGFGTAGRNSLRGPNFFDMDAAVMKSINITERMKFSFGAQAFNLLNHTNFDQPVGDISNPLFGTTVATVGPPTSILGSFVGAGSSPRLLEIKGTLNF